MTSGADTALIALDWGTTSLRAYRLGCDGELRERRESSLGILNVTDGDFAAALDTIAGDWRRAAPGAKLLASGMIGSRQGWREVPYCAAPAGLDDLAAGLAPVLLPDGAMLHLVPGLSMSGRDGMPDVIRGEETQILGVLEESEADACCILPGTHSKWARAGAGRIGDFATFMTGELYALLKAHSILGRTMVEGEAAADAFARGVAAGYAADGLLHRLFSVRTLALSGALAAEDGADYLSGLLIGAELREGLAWLGGEAADAPLRLIGQGPLCARYGQALTGIGRAFLPVPPDAAARGLFRLALAAHLLDP